MAEVPAKVPFDKLEIPELWKDEPRIMLGARPRQYAVAPMSGRNIAQFSALAVGLKSTAAQMADGNVADNLEQLYRVVHFGLLRAYPDLTFDEFYDSDTQPEQLQLAFETVAKAAGVTVRVVPAGESPAVPSVEQTSSTDGTTL